MSKGKCMQNEWQVFAFPLQNCTATILSLSFSAPPFVRKYSKKVINKGVNDIRIFCRFGKPFSLFNPKTRDLQQNSRKLCCGINVYIALNFLSKKCHNNLAEMIYQKPATKFQTNFAEKKWIVCVMRTNIVGDICVVVLARPGIRPVFIRIKLILCLFWGDTHTRTHTMTQLLVFI